MAWSHDGTMARSHDGMMARWRGRTSVRPSVCGSSLAGGGPASPSPSPSRGCHRLAS